MKFIPQRIADILLIEPQVHGDSRGYFFESFRHDKFVTAIGQDIRFTQDNESKSTRGVLRGLHYQLPPFAQSKLVRVIAGSVLDVAVDIRRGSPTFGQHVALELSAENKRQLFIPRGFAHGFVVLSDSAIFSYKVDNPYAPEQDRGIAWNDPRLAIDWGMTDEDIQLSPKDRELPQLQQAHELFEFGVNLYASN
jgi:dTDP-4-dehydrorhamnose 3,5-epimerase